MRELSEALAMSPRLSTREISDRLSDDIQAVTYNLLREPNRALSTRSELRFGKKGSLSVVIRGPKRGKWFDHEAGAEMAAKKVREEFLEGASAIAEDSAQARYLRSRGHSGPIPAALRCGGKGGFIVNGVFTPALPYYHGGVRVDDTPAMGAEITQPDGTVAGVHVTYLTEDGHKARVPQAKKVHGHKDGGAIRLTGAGTVLALTEGIETALAILKARPDLAVWAAVDAGNIAKQVLPPVVRHVLICADNDGKRNGPAQGTGSG